MAFGFGDLYTQGLASIDAAHTSPPGNASVVIGNGTLWSTAVLPGDGFEVDGIRVTILDVADDTHLTLAYDWPGTSFTDQPYIIRLESGQRATTVDLAGRVRDQINRLRIFDHAVPVFSIKEFEVNDPPIDALVDDIYVVGEAGTGAFGGHENEVAEKTETGWLFTIPTHGYHVVDQEQNLVYFWDGSEWLGALGLGTALSYVGDWNNSDTFTPGQVVSDSDQLWTCRVENSNSQPATGNDDWRKTIALGLDGGGFAFPFTFLTDTADSDPGSGKLKFNAAAGSATILRVSRYDLHGNDIATLLAGISTSTTSTQKGRLRIATRLDLARQWTSIVMSATAVADYYNLTLSSPLLVQSALQNSTEVVLFFSERGDKGATGDTGTTGARGFAGGPVAIDYVLDLSSIADSDPGNGKIRFNNATQASATVLRVDLLSSLGSDVTALVDSISTSSTSPVKVKLRLFDRDDPSKYLTFNITDVETKTGYRNLTAVLVGSSGTDPFSGAGNLVAGWVDKGDKGNTGTMSVGTVTTGVPGSDVTIFNSGSAEAAVLDFTIPRGDAGENFMPQYVVAAIGDRDAYDTGPAMDENGMRLSVLVESDSSNGDQPTLYFLLAEGSPATWSDGILFGVVADTDPQFATIELGDATDTTLTRIAAGRVAIEDIEIVKVGDSPQLTTIELGDASDTTVSRPAAGRMQVEGKEVITAKDLSSVMSVADQAIIRRNIGAASLAAMAANNVVVNGGVKLSQELGTTGAALANNTAKYIADCIEAHYNHGAASAVVTSAQVAAASFPAVLAAFDFGHQIKATTAITSPASGDFARHKFQIEGYRVASWGWGATGAADIVWAFQYYSTASGTAFIRLQNSGAGRFYYHELTVAAGWNFFSGTIPGDSSGTWLKTTGTGLEFSIFSSGKETTPQSSLDAWGTAAKVQTTNSTNLLGTNNNLTIVTGLYIAAGTQVPLAADLPRLMRSYDVELPLCQRYVYAHVSGTGKGVGLGTYFGTTQYNCWIQFPTTMRVAPSLSAVAGAGYYVSSRNAGEDYIDNWTIYQPSTGAALIYNTDTSLGTDGQATYCQTANAAASIIFLARL